MTFQQAVGQAVTEYEQKLSMEQSRTQTQQSAIAELQGQVQVLQVSLASQRDLPSVGVTQEGVNLRDEVFNYIPGTVNTNQGAQWFTIHLTRHFHFRNMSDSGTDLTGLIWSRMLLAQVLQHHQHYDPHNCHPIHRHHSAELVRCR